MLILVVKRWDNIILSVPYDDFLEPVHYLIDE